MERDTTILEAGTGDSPNPRSDDDNKVTKFSLGICAVTLTERCPATWSSIVIDQFYISDATDWQKAAETVTTRTAHRIPDIPKLIDCVTCTGLSSIT
jgi:hypothetical protein